MLIQSDTLLPCFQWKQLPSTHSINLNYEQNDTEFMKYSLVREKFNIYFLQVLCKY